MITTEDVRTYAHDHAIGLMSAKAVLLDIEHANEHKQTPKSLNYHALDIARLARRITILEWVVRALIFVELVRIISELIR